MIVSVSADEEMLSVKVVEKSIFIGHPNSFVS